MKSEIEDKVEIKLTSLRTTLKLRPSKKTTIKVGPAFPVPLTNHRWPSVYSPKKQNPPD